MDKPQIKILLAEDDHNLGTILKAYLEAKGYPTTLCPDGQQAYDAFIEENFNFCILDVMMPVKDGFSLAKDIRKVDKTVPILFLTAKNMQEDILEGLKIGADDYMTKPLTSKEAQLLKMLCDRTNYILERSEALTKIWLDDNYFNARSMDVYIAKLRKYLKDDPDVELINIHGKGFKLLVNKEDDED